MPFKDHFSDVAQQYAAHRPHYPAVLFEWLAALAPGRERALDVGTGNGQAAVGLAEHFAEVLATDPSAAQIALAVPHAHVMYRTARAEHSGLPDASVDLVTAATAAHWFDHAAFHHEVIRVLRPGGVLAVWNYAPATVAPAVDAVMARFQDRIRAFWPPERLHVDSGYRTLPFPFPDLPSIPSFECRMRWKADQFLGYVGTWSAVQQARNAGAADPLMALAEELHAAWGSKALDVRWPLALRAGRSGTAQ